MTARPTVPVTWPIRWRRPIRGSGSAIGARSRGWAGPTSTDFGVALEAGAQIVVQMDADWSHDPASLPALTDPIGLGDADLVIGSRYCPGGGVVDWGLGPQDHLAWRQPLRPDRPRPRAARPDRRLQGLASADAGRHPVRRGPCRRLRLPDRDDLPGEPAGRPDQRSADHVPRSPGRPVEDVPPDHRRGPDRRPAAPLG